MTLRIETFPAGPAATNAYVVADDATGDAIVVDAPHAVTATILAAARARGWTVRRIVVTHTHWDHVADAAELRAATGVPLAAHPLARRELEAPSGEVGPPPFPIAPVPQDEELAEGDTVTVGGHLFRVLHLPGHDPSHIVLLGDADRVMLGGDVLFPNGHGRTDLPGADGAAMLASLRRLLDLPPETVVYPGHGQPTTIGAEAAWIRALGAGGRGLG